MNPPCWWIGCLGITLSAAVTNVGIVLCNGGTLYIDDGKPTPHAISQTIRNLREISPTVYFNVPKGFEMIAQRLPELDELRRSFYRRSSRRLLDRSSLVGGDA